MAWVQALLLGDGVTTAAVLAVASCGLGLLMGRRHRRAGLQAAISLGIVFSAMRITYGLLAVAQGEADSHSRAVAQLPGQVEAPRLAVEVKG